MDPDARRRKLIERFDRLSERDQRQVLAYAAELLYAAREVAAGRAARPEDVSLDADWDDGYAELARRRGAAEKAEGGRGVIDRPQPYGYRPASDSGLPPRTACDPCHKTREFALESV